VPSRLTELLERIRPAGAPGAAAEGEPAVDVAAEDELAAVARVLARFEAEADDVVDSARRRAEQLMRDAQRDAERTQAAMAERIAVARAEVTRTQERRGDAEATRLGEEAKREADRRRASAAARVDDVVALALERIWALADVPSSSDSTPERERPEETER
jgi:vacuolar-type H+-ATPase subunit H